MARKAKPVETSIHDRERIIVRLPDGMREEIEKRAEGNARSLTAEVIAALEAHLRTPSTTDKLISEVSRHDLELTFMDSQLDRLNQAVNELYELTHQRRSSATYLQMPPDDILR